MPKTNSADPDQTDSERPKPRSDCFWKAQTEQNQIRLLLKTAISEEAVWSRSSSFAFVISPALGLVFTVMGELKKNDIFVLKKNLI